MYYKETSGETSRLLKNPEKIEQLKNDLKNMTLILPNQLFLDRKNKIETSQVKGKKHWTCKRS